MICGMQRSAPVALSVIAIAAICALMLAWPGQTVTTKYVNDLFIFLDGVHRIDLGQVPNREFHTALGPLVYYAPALGYWLTDDFGGSMPVGIALLVLALALPASHVLSSRFRPAIAIPLAVCLILIAAVPINLGESIAALSFAMFYNRIGWAALGFLLVMHLLPERPRRFQGRLDAASAAFLVTLMLYIKISYGIVGLGFLLLQLLNSRQRRWSFTAFILTAASCLVVELFWQGTKAHIADLLLAGNVSGSLKTIDEVAQVLFRNLADYVVFLLIMGLALWHTRSLRDFLFYGFCAGSGYLLIMQNFQNWGVITLVAGAAVAAESLARKNRTTSEGSSGSLAAGAYLLFLVFALPMSLHNGAALTLHAGLALRDSGEAVPLQKFGRIKLARLWNEGDHGGFVRYFASLDDGAQALSDLHRNVDNVLVLDFVTPFSAGLDLKAPRGDSTWHHWGRTVNEHSFVPAESLFRDVHIVMEPKWPIDSSTTDGLRTIYAEYIGDRYELALETKDWKVHVLRDPPAETVSRSPGFGPDDPRLRPLPRRG